jgi:hypothetical protein
MRKRMMVNNPNALVSSMFGLNFKPAKPIPRNANRRLNYDQAHRKYGISPFGDEDHDGHLNMFDCRPLDKRKHGIIGDYIEHRKLKKLYPEIYRVSQMAQRAGTEYGGNIQYKKTFFGSKYHIGKLAVGKEYSVTIPSDQQTVGMFHHHPTPPYGQGAIAFNKQIRSDYPSRPDIEAAKIEAKRKKRPWHEIITAQSGGKLVSSRHTITPIEDNKAKIELAETHRFGHQPKVYALTNRFKLWGLR